MFKKKPVIKVIKVKTEKREFEDTVSSHYSFGAGSSSETNKHTKNVTTVLGSINGELATREFNGSWDMEDIKTWEEL